MIQLGITAHRIFVVPAFTNRNNQGTSGGQLVKEAALQMLQQDVSFHEGVDRGIAAAAPGEFVDNAEVWANVEKILHS